jgi:hypothetical protein
MVYAFRYSHLVALMLVGACTTVPSSPTVLVLAGTGRSFEQFHTDDSLCRQFAGTQVGSSTEPGTAEDVAYTLQRRYDYGYMQCMYAKGHKVPVSGRFTSSSPNAPAANALPPSPSAPLPLTPSREEPTR